MSAWKTAQGWAQAGLAGVPTSKRNVNAMAAREGWNLLGPDKARKRQGLGGGWEYHVSCLPEAAQAEWARRHQIAEKSRAVEVASAKQLAEIERTPAEMSARVREVMQARAAVLIEIERRALHGGGFDKAAKAMLADAGAGTLEPAILIETLALASDRRRGGLPSVRSIYNWKAARNAAGSVTALAPTRAPQQVKQDVPDWMAGFLRHWQNPTKVGINAALAAYTASLRDPSQAPSYDQVVRALKALRGTQRYLDAYKGREGPQQLKARLGFVRRTTDGLDPTTVYSADGKTFDAYVAHPVHGQPFRPEITTVIDVVTRKVVGWSVGLAENQLGVADALRYACETHGIPAIFYTDNGSGYKNAALDHDTLGMCARLSITTTHSLPYNSQARGIIERVQGTIWNALAKLMPSYQGADMDREAHKARWKQIQKDVKEVGTSRLLPGWDFFLKAVEAAVEAYNSADHRSLRERDPITGRMRPCSPAQLWDRFVSRGFAPTMLAPGEADDLFRPYFYRVARRGEIQWNSNQYYDDALQPFDGMEVCVGIDIHDASRVWVRRVDIVDGEKAAGALICVAGYWANKVSYMPKSMVEAASEKREKGRLGRIERKRDEIVAEARSRLIENLPEMPAAFVPREPAPVPVAAVHQAEIVPLRAEPVAPPSGVLGDDASLARACLADPALLTPGRARVLREVLNSHSGPEYLRLSGVDVSALQALLMSAA